MLSKNEKVNEEVLRKLKVKGFSTVPVYDGNKNNLVGILKTKLVLDEKYNDAPLGNLKLGTPLVVSKDTSMFEMLMIFQVNIC